MTPADRILAGEMVPVVLSEGYAATFFHGTPIVNLGGVLRDGLQRGRPVTWGGTRHGETRNWVYLTPDKELAARYAVGHRWRDTPVVLEVRLTGAKRFRRLHWDPLDRSAEVWQDDAGGAWEDSEGVAVQELSREAGAFLAKYAGGRERDHRHAFEKAADMDSALSGSLSSLDGFNLYKFLLKRVADAVPYDRFRRIRPALTADIRRTFPEGELQEFLELTPSGTIRISHDWHSGKEQLMYGRGLPAASIKAVWIRRSDFPWIESSTHERFGHRELPDETKRGVEQLRKWYDKVLREADDLLNVDEDYDPDDVASVVADASAVVDEWAELFDGEDVEILEPIGRLKAMLLGAVDDPNHNPNLSGMKRLVGEIVSAARNGEEHVSDEWGDERVRHRQEWVRLDRRTDAEKITRLIRNGLEPHDEMV